MDAIFVADGMVVEEQFAYAVGDRLWFHLRYFARIAELPTAKNLHSVLSAGSRYRLPRIRRCVRFRAQLLLYRAIRTPRASSRRALYSSSAIASSLAWATAALAQCIRRRTCSSGIAWSPSRR